MNFIFLSIYNRTGEKKPSMKILLTAPNEGTVELIITLCTKLANDDIIPV